MTFNIKSERVRLGMSADDVAKAIGVHINAIRRWETGQSEPSASNLIKLSGLYQCTPDYLLGITDDRHGKAVPIPS